MIQTSCLTCAESCLAGCLTNEEKESLDSNKSCVHFEAGDTILKQGTYTSQVVYIKRGLAKVVLEGTANKTVILRLIDSKQFVAMPFLGSTDVHPYSLITISDCEICLIRKEFLEGLNGKNPDVNRFTMGSFFQEYHLLYRRFTEINSLNNHGKLASALLYISTFEEGETILNMLTRKEIAELACISVESANKILSELKHERIISIEGKKIKIMQPKLIERLSTFG